jgi:hypothetical protein
MEEEKVLLDAQLPVVSLSRLLLQVIKSCQILYISLRMLYILGQNIVVGDGKYGRQKSSFPDELIYLGLVP